MKDDRSDSGRWVRQRECGWIEGEDVARLVEREIKED